MAKILLIEPNTLLARMYTQALMQDGHEVVHVGGAQAAINAADTCTPNVVILELQLDEHDGIEFLQEFRSYSEWQGVPVIINTFLRPRALAVAERTLKQELGVTRCLYKPRTSLKQLLRHVTEQVVGA